MFILKHYKIAFTTFTLFLAILLVLTGCSQEQEVNEVQPLNKTEIAHDNSRVYKILHIMSFHSPWRWTDDQLEGFQDALQGLNIEYRVFQMDGKNNSSEMWLEKKGKEARELIKSWRPDLVYTSDDPAQEYVTKHYLNSDIPFVFSGVNATPEEYGFLNSSNVTGVLEVEHFVQSARLLKEIAPEIQKIAVVIDDSPMWDPVITRMKANLEKLPELDFVIWDKILTFSEYKQKIKEYQNQVDAIALIGIFNFKREDNQGNTENVHYQEVLQWTAENSQLPDFSFWMDRVYYGTLCVVSVSGYEQGLTAGKIARTILLDGQSPSSIPIKPTVKGQPFISLARARKLGLKINSTTLLNSQVITKFDWEK